MGLYGRNPERPVRHTLSGIADRRHRWCAPQRHHRSAGDEGLTGSSYEVSLRTASRRRCGPHPPSRTRAHEHGPGGTPRDGRGVGDQPRPPTARDGQLPSGGRRPIPIAGIVLHRPNREDQDSVFAARVGIRPISETFLASSKSTHSATSQSGMRSGIRSTITTTSIRYGPRAFGMPEKPRDGRWVCGQTRMICPARVRASKVCPGRKDDLGRGARNERSVRSIRERGRSDACVTALLHRSPGDKAADRGFDEMRQDLEASRIGTPRRNGVRGRRCENASGKTRDTGCKDTTLHKAEPFDEWTVPDESWTLFRSLPRIGLRHYGAPNP